MRIAPTSHYLPYGYFNLNLGIREPTVPSVAFAGDAARATLRDLARNVLDLRDSLTKLRSRGTLQQFDNKPVAVAAVAVSSSPVGLTFGAPATLVSTAEVNATSTSFSPFGPTVSGSSLTTSLPTIDGVYDGDQGDDTLTFEFKDTGDVGDKSIDIEVRDGADKKIETIKIDKNDPIGTPVELKNGLTVSLSAGFVKKNDTFTVTVSQSVGSAVDPTKAFNGTRNDRPNFEYGNSVVAGSFFINGVAITVAADDTLNGVLSKITSSAAGVTAVFNSVTEQVELTQKSNGSGQPITLGADTTGFFAATKLSGATSTPGVDSDLDVAISTVAALSGIGSGTFSVNGTVLSIDTSVDSLNDVMARINSAGANAIASFDENTNVMRITAGSGGSLSLSGGTSGLFAAVNIADGPYQPTQSSSSISTVDSDKVGELRDMLREFGDGLQSLFTTAFDSSTAGPARFATERLRSAVFSAFEREFGAVEGERLRTGLGIDFFFDEPEKGIFRIDRDRLTRSLTDRFDLLSSFLQTDEGSEPHQLGLFPALERALDEIGKSVADDVDPIGGRGLIVNLRA